MPEAFSPPPRFSDPDMHHGTCITHVPWCMPGSLTSGFLWSRLWGKRSRHSRRMRNPRFCVSGKRPMAGRNANITDETAGLSFRTVNLIWCTSLRECNHISLHKCYPKICKDDPFCHSSRRILSTYLCTYRCKYHWFITSAERCMLCFHLCYLPKFAFCYVPKFASG